MSTDAAAPVPTNHPKGFYFFFWGEFAERCSYYGMRAILPLYLTSVIGYEDGKAASTYSLFKMMCYFLPLLGGFLADRFFGKYWTIVAFSVPYVLGQFLLCVPNENAMLVALLLLAMGSGVIKPNISTLMGLTYDQQRPGQLSLRSAGFQWFYFSVNIGALLSLFALPLIRDKVFASTDNLRFAYQVSFSIPAFFMILALIAFAAGKKHYAVEKIDRTPLTPEESAARWKTLTNLFGIFFLMIFYWIAYEQNDNLWTFFARDYMDRKVFGFEFPPDGFQYINAFLVLTFIPLFNFFFQSVDPKQKVFKPTLKILIGLIGTGLSAGVMGCAAMNAGGAASTLGAEGAVKVSAWWIVFAYVVLTFGEVLLYGTGLELAFSAAPPNMKGFITAVFLITNALGNLVNSFISPLYGKEVSPMNYYFGTMAVVLMACVAMYFVGKRFNRLNAPAPAVNPSPDA